MALPTFTKAEAELLTAIRAQDGSAFDIGIKYSPWIVITAAVFLYGFINSQREFVFGGFIVAFGLLCRGLYYHAIDSKTLKSIIDKYEKSCVK